MKKLMIILIAMFSIFTLHAQEFTTEGWGIPYYRDDAQIYEYEGFVIEYSEEHEQARWVAYLLTAYEAEAEVAERRNNFRVDPIITTGSAHPDDYKRTGYDRGHLAPAGDMRWSEEAMSDSFYMSNMSPQAPGFNRIIWKNLEALVRNWAIENGELYIITGPILTDGPYETIGENEVTIPKRYFKVIMDYQAPDFRGIAFILPNEKTDVPLFAYAVTIDTVEYITGIDFFHLLPDIIEEDLEAQARYFDW